MSKFYSHLSLYERRKIYFWCEEKLSIFREIQRNTFFCEEDKKLNGYFHVTAQECYHRRRQKQQKVEVVPGLKDFIVSKIKRYWSPEQIAGYLKHISHTGLYACHETIYLFIYSAESKELSLYRYLFRSRKHRNRRAQRRSRKWRGLPKSMLIHNRPDNVDLRQNIGHWEADLMMFERDLGQANITTLTERTSRYTFLLKNQSRHSRAVMGRIREVLSKLPKSSRQTVTFDQGSEFMAHFLLSKQLNIKSYYCDPRSPWQKGTVENTNSRIRRFLPRNTDLEKLSDQEIALISAQLNNTPRKCLNYKTPKEVFMSLL